MGDRISSASPPLCAGAAGKHLGDVRGVPRPRGAEADCGARARPRLRPRRRRRQARPRRPLPALL
eukprot:1187001-Prorocentrum_minimum.AAC.4